MENENINEVTPEIDAWDSDWSDIDLSDVNDSEGGAVKEPADKPAESAEAEQPDEARTETPAQSEADQSFTVKVLGEERTVSREEAPTYIQKGMDYDRVKDKLAQASTELEQLRAAAPANAKNARYAEFLETLATQAGLQPDAFIAQVRAQNLAKSENIPLAEATARIKLQDREQELQRREQALQQPDPQKQREREFVEFFKANPDVKAADIPNEVYEKMRQGQTLQAAFAEHRSETSAREMQGELDRLRQENEQFRKDIEALQQSKKNAARSAGSAESRGKDSKMDDFDAAWYDGT